MADKQLDQWNDAWRSSEHYDTILRSVGADPSKPLKLDDIQRKAVQAALEQVAGRPFDKGLEIDPAGNINQNEGLGKQLKRWGPLAAGIGLTLSGVPGVMPGLLTKGAATTAAAASGSSGAFGGMNLGGVVPTGITAPAGMAAAGATGATGAGMGWLDVLKGQLRNPSNLMGAAGRMLTGGAQASASNRGAQLDATMAANELNQQAYRDWMNQMMQREQTGMGTRNDAWKALMQGDYTANWKPSGQKFSPYTRELAAPSDALREAGASRAADARTRLTGYTMPTPERQGYTLDPSLLKGDMWEKLQGYLGAGLEGLGALSR